MPNSPRWLRVTSPEALKLGRWSHPWMWQNQSTLSSRKFQWRNPCRPFYVEIPQFTDKICLEKPKTYKKSRSDGLNSIGRWQFRVTNQPTPSLHDFWTVEGNQSTRSKPTWTRGEHVNSTQKRPARIQTRDLLAVRWQCIPLHLRGATAVYFKP